VLLSHLPAALPQRNLPSVAVLGGQCPAGKPGHAPRLTATPSRQARHKTQPLPLHASARSYRTCAINLQWVNFRTHAMYACTDRHAIAPNCVSQPPLPTLRLTLNADPPACSTDQLSSPVWLLFLHPTNPAWLLADCPALPLLSTSPSCCLPTLSVQASTKGLCIAFTSVPSRGAGTSKLLRGQHRAAQPSTLKHT